MKGKFLTLLLLVLTLSLALIGCKPDKSDGASGGTQPPQSGGNGDGGSSDLSDPNAVFSTTTAVNIVIGAGAGSEAAYQLQEAIFMETDLVAKIYPSLPDTPLEHAIYIGRVDNAMSEKAYKKLENLVEEAELDSFGEEVHAGYAVYASGNSIAIAFSQDMYDSTIDVAVNDFITEFVKGKKSLAANEGFIKTECYPYIEFLEKVDDKYYEKAWAELLEVTKNPELVTALRKLKELYGEGVVSWLANLYDEEIGGFYYSNSGRNNVGFLPDIDSTYQAIVLVGHMGMQEDFGYGRGSYPANFWQQVGSFVKKLQDPNGYFYHPQWTKEMVDSKLSRRGRDLDRAELLLGYAGMKPTYDTPNGKAGDGLVWDESTGSFISPEYLTNPLSESTVSAVSKIVAVDSTAAVATHLQTEEALRSYLNEFIRLEKNFYPVNNEIANQTNQILARDKQLAKEGADWRAVPIIIDFLNDNQNPENGTWSDVINYNAVDGLFKAAHIYEAFGYPIPNAMAGAVAAINAITSSQDTSHICNIYNCWCTIQMVVKNLRQFGSPEEANTVVEKIREVAAPSIEATLAKYLEYRKDDHSFSYYKDRCSAESQGMQLAIQCNEGDMNATSLCHSVWPTVFSVLELGEYEVPLRGSADFARFISIMDGIGGVIKDPAPAPKVITFDGDDPGEVSDEVTYTFNSDNAYAVIAEDPRAGADGNVLKLVSHPGGGDIVYVGVDKNSLGSCFIFEGEFCVADAKKDYVMQINLGSNGYMLNIKLVDAIDERGEPYKKVQILECSSQGSPRIERDLGISSRLGEWFKIRFEYYVGSHDSVRIKVFFNDTLAAVTDNYYDHKGEKITTGVGAPQRYYSYTQINVMSGQEATILMDNLFAAKTDDRYVPAHDLNNQPLINCDPPNRDEVIYDFEDLEAGKNYPSDFTVTENSGSVEVVEANGTKKLNIKALGEKTGPTFYLPAVTRTPKTNCAVAEMDVVANSGDVGSALNVRFRANNKISGDTGSITAFNLEIVEINGEKYVTVAEAPNGATVALIENGSVKVGNSFKLRLEHYEDAHVTLIYVNGNLIASSDKLTTGGGNRSFERLEISTITESKIDVSIDNLKAERIVKSFTEATKPDVDEKVYDFENGISQDLVTNANVTTVTDGKALLLNDGKSLAVPLNVRAVVTNFYRFNAKTTFGGINESTYRLAFVTETGAYVLAFELVHVSGEIFIYEFTENGRASRPIASFTPSIGADLTVEYFPTNSVCQITYGKNCVAVTGVNYSDEADSFEIAKLTVTAVGQGSLILDDCVFESYNALYVEKTPIGENDEDGAEKITFESSSSGNIPSAITYKLVSLGAAVRIEEFIDKQNAATKALVFDSTADAGGDEVVFKVTDPAEGEWNALVFEADLAFRAENLNRLSYQIFFEGASDSENTRQYLTSIAHGDGKLKIKDYSYGSSTVTTEIDGQTYRITRNDGPLVTLSEPSVATEWFTLRIEIFKGARNEMRILTYINDSLVYVTNNFYRSHISDEPNALDKATQVRILALTECEATILMDNVSLTQTTKDIPADPESGATVKLFPMTNKPSLVIPEVPDDTDIPEIIDYENDRIYTNTKVEDRNGTEQPTLEIKDGKLYFISDGGDYIYITPTVKKGSYNHASFEADMTFAFDTTKTTGNVTFYTFSVSDESKKTSFRFNIEYNIAAGEIKFVALNTGKTYASTVMSKVIGTPGVPTQETITLNYRIEYYFIGSDAVILNYFDNELVYAVNSRETQSYVTSDGVAVDYNLYFNYSATTPTSPLGTVGRIEINSHSGTNTSMSLDNLRFVQDNKTLDESLVAPKPGTLIKGTTGTGVYYKQNGGYQYNITKIWNEADLNNAAATSPFIWRSTGGSNDRRYVTADGKSAAGTAYGYIQIASQGTNKALEYGQATSDDRNSRIYLKSTNAKGNLYVFETDLVIGSVSGLETGDALLSFFFGTSYTEQSAFFGSLKVIKTSDGYALGSSADKTFASLNGSTWYNIAVEYYHKENIVRYYVNGERVATERIVSTLEIGNYEFASVALAANAYDAFVRLDNTVVSAYNEEFVAIDGEVDSLATVLPVKGGASGIAVLIHDDGDLDTVARLDRIYGQYSLKADIAMVVDRVYDKATNTVKPSAAQWQTYLDKGWGVINHSLTHTLWGSATEEELTIDEEKLIEEIIKSGEYLRAAFPTERVLTFAYPGFSNVTDTLGYGKAKVYAAAKALIKANYISGREYNFTTSNHNTIRFFDLDYGFLPASSISLGAANLQKDLDRIDGAALGGITVLFSHKVCADGEEKTTDTSTVPESYIKAIAEKVSGYVNEGVLWNAHYENAILYLREAQAASVKTVSGSDNITVTLTDTLDDTIYNYALTVEVIVPTSWAGVKVVQNGNTSYAKAFERDGKWIVYVDITPDAGDAVLTPETENLPQIPTLPCDHADADGDGYCEKCTREYHDQSTCVHKDAEGNGECDKCKADYYDPATCPHVDSDIDRICDNCKTTYYDPATCEHIDTDPVDAKCDNCGVTYYTEATCPGHKDADGNTVCDTCGCRYADPDTCRHKDADGNSKCDKCEITYHDPATCEHIDYDEDEICDKCEFNLGEAPALGGSGSDNQGWLKKEE